MYITAYVPRQDWLNKIVKTFKPFKPHVECEHDIWQTKNCSMFLETILDNQNDKIFLTDDFEALELNEIFLQDIASICE